MGHLVGKDIYRQLGQKLDELITRAPWNERLQAILQELYSLEEAELIVKMPYGLANLQRLKKCTGYSELRLRNLLEGLCQKGLVVDWWMAGEYRYMPSPMVIGVFEFTMMRTGDNLNTQEWARLFHEYLQGDDSFYQANCGNGEQIGMMRTLAYPEAMLPEEHIEILDYEKAVALIDEAKIFSMGICSCRHEKLHIRGEGCGAALDNCSSLGPAAAYLIRHNLAREVSKSEMIENVQRSKETGLVLNADNVRKNIAFICHCCACCCNVLLGISKFGYTNLVLSSSFIAQTTEKCTGCKVCVHACPINAIAMKPVPDAGDNCSQQQVVVDESLCLGCGVCALKCKFEGIRLVRRQQRVIPPANIFEKVLLQAIEKERLSYLLFDNPHSRSHNFMRALVGGFLRLNPVKKALMSELARSTFFRALAAGLRWRGIEL